MIFLKRTPAGHRSRDRLRHQRDLHPAEAGQRSAFVQMEHDGGGSPREPKLAGTGD